MSARQGATPDASSSSAMISLLPTGVVTLLFTDIEGSTRLLRDLGDAYDEALAGHRRIVRGAVPPHGGGRDGGAGLGRPSPRRPGLPPSPSRRPGRGRQDAPGPRGGGAPAGPLPARGPLRPARSGGITRHPACGGGRVTPVPHPYAVQWLSGPGAARGLPARAGRPPRPRQLRAPRGGLGTPGRGRRRGARSGAAGHLARAPP